jgi:dolichol-phosphate mannosyltransferase
LNEPFAVLLPVYNEAPTLERVVRRVQEIPGADVVIVDDGSTDATPSILERIRVTGVIRQDPNQGYGKSLMAAFDYAKSHDYRHCVTMDADEQHEPEFIPKLLEGLSKYDIVSGSRYLDPSISGDAPPPERLEVNRLITAKLRPLTGYDLTDSFCGFKAYRVDALRKFQLDETNYGFPIQFWLRAAKAGLTVVESPVPLIYKDHSRNFNNQFANRDERLNHYLEVMEREAKALGLTPLSRA